MKFCLSIRFLLSAFHGRRDDDAAEWPPSPWRVFQSLVAVAGARGRGEFPSLFRSALLWLEKQPPPVIIAPKGFISSGYSLSVPNNALDIVAKAWSRGSYSTTGDANPATHRTMKHVRPTLLPDGNAAHYIWSLQEPITEEVHGQLKALSEMARSLFALGWGIDVAVANARVINDEEAEALSGERWIPEADDARDGLRALKKGTLDRLIQHHQEFRARLGPQGFRPPLPVSVYRLVDYRSAYSRRRCPIAAFSLLKLDATSFRVFNTVRRTPRVVEMIRGAAERAAKRAGWDESKISTLIKGHGESRGALKHTPVQSARFAWLPLPTLEKRGERTTGIVGGIRRIIVTSFNDGFDDEIAWARRALAGEELLSAANGAAEALLAPLPHSDPMVQRYVRPATTWATVTPVVLPGYDDPNHYRNRLAGSSGRAQEQQRLLDRIAQRVQRLLRKAIVQAGLSQELADLAELQWHGFGPWPGTDLANRYTVPDHLVRFPRLHVQISWRDRGKQPIAIPGPICLGGGRFYGLGLFAPLRE
jgi:CRISPR-associated protein Csb2